MDAEKYNLTWNDYPDHLRTLMHDLMVSEDFADVTLVTDDKKKVRAHRHVLSACSPVFKEILQIEKQNNHPFIYLRGIQYSEIEQILQFMYLGEAKLYEERLNEFLSAVRDLEIKELYKRVKTNQAHDKTTQKLEEDSNFTSENDDYNIKLEEADNVGSNDSMQQTGKPISRFQCTRCDKTFSGKPGLWLHTKSVHEGVKYPCSQCDFQAKRQLQLTEHIQSKHEGVMYGCNQCDKQYIKQRDVTRHIKYKHKGIRYACKQCDKLYSDQPKLNRHIQTIHECSKYE